MNRDSIWARPDSLKTQRINQKTITQNTTKLKLKTQPWCEQHFHGQINLQLARKGKRWAAVHFNGLKSNMEDNLGCCQLLCLYDSLICSEYINIFIRKDALSQAIPLGNVKKKTTHYLPEMPTDQVTASVSAVLCSASYWLFPISFANCKSKVCLS